MLCKPAESKSTNDNSTDQPVAPVASSSTTSNGESCTTTPNITEELKIASQLRKFNFGELKSATRNFRPESLLGEGGFGCVFKGWINENGTAPVKPGTGLTVAVKTLNHDGLQGHKEWLVCTFFRFDSYAFLNIRCGKNGCFWWVTDDLAVHVKTGRVGCPAKTLISIF